MNARTKRPRPTSGPVEGADEPVRYVETSALLAAVLDREGAAVEALRADGQRVTSALTFAEAFRALARGAATGQLTTAQVRAAARALRTFERRCLIVAVTDAVLARVRRPFPVEPIRTLDAIHLSTAELLGEPPMLMTIITRDARVERNARALGYAVA
jgi:predicted nucleic acid-binding protein